MNWDDYRYFAELARAGSVRGAAARLGVNASTVLRRLDALEDRVGIKLFRRTPGGLEATDAGAEIASSIAAVAQAFALLESRLAERAKAAAGRITLSVPEELAAPELFARIAEFGVAHPELELECVTDVHARQRETDLSILVTDEPEPTWIGRPLARLRLATYGSRDYLEHHDPFGDPARCLWIGSDLERFAPEYRHREFPELLTQLTCADVSLACAALRAGAGVGLLPCILGDREPLLARVDAALLDAPQIWLFFRPELRGVGRIQIASEFLRTVFEDLSAALLGGAAG